MAKLPDIGEPEVFGFLLLPHFPMLAFSAAIEPLRIANWITGRELYVWRAFSKDGRPVAASNGCLLTPHGGLPEIGGIPAIFVCAGVGGCYYREREVFAWLRRMARQGVVLGGIGTAAYVLARAGLLGGYRCTIHWEDMSTFRDEFPQLEVTSSLYEVDRSRITCSGGTAALDMMLGLISARHGPLLAGEIADQFMKHRVRQGSNDQRMSLTRRTGIQDRRLLAAIAIMEQQVEEPVTLLDVCKASDLSLRHLQRLFQEHLGMTPLEFYRLLRLRHARGMLLHGSDSILDVATASGFISASHFTRRYREIFGVSPSEERRRQRNGQRLTAPTTRPLN